MFTTERCMPQQVGVTAQRACFERIDSRSFVWALGSLCQLHRMPFDQALVLSQAVPPYDWSALVTAATSLGFRCELSERSTESLDTWAFPSIVFMRPAANEQTETVDLALL